MKTQAGPLCLRAMEGTYASGEYLSLMTLGCGPLGKEGKMGSCGEKLIGECVWENHVQDSEEGWIEQSEMRLQLRT